MKTSNGATRTRRSRTSPTQRAQLLAAFERSGLSVAAFARQHRLHYTTFCGWRARQAKANPSPGFVEVEWAAPSPATTELVIELGAQARLRITQTTPMVLVARLLQALHTPTPC